MHGFSFFHLVYIFQIQRKSLTWERKCFMYIHIAMLYLLIRIVLFLCNAILHFLNWMPRTTGLLPISDCHAFVVCGVVFCKQTMNKQVLRCFFIKNIFNLFIKYLFKYVKRCILTLTLVKLILHLKVLVLNLRFRPIITIYAINYAFLREGILVLSIRL